MAAPVEENLQGENRAWQKEKFGKDELFLPSIIACALLQP